MMFVALMATALAFTPDDAAFAMKTASDFVFECTPRDAGTIRGGLAANWILDRTSLTGATIRRDVFQAETPMGTRRMCNLYAEFVSNPERPWILLLSHFDTKPGVSCPGANDGASTTALLMTLARKFTIPGALKGNVMLVWTDGEECQGQFYTPEDGFHGARRAVEYLRSKKRKVKAVIGLDMLGDRELNISIPLNGTPALARIAHQAARRIGEPKLVTSIVTSVKDDHAIFLAAGYPAIDLIDFDYGPANAWWHTPEDTCDKLSKTSLLKVGRLICEMLDILL